MSLLGLGLALLIGLSLGFLGGGGSILTVPVLVYVSGFEAKQAIAMSLPVVGATSLVGAVNHWRAGNVRIRTALVFGLCAMVGAYLGARLSVLLSGAAQLALLGVIMLVASLFMLRRREPAEATMPSTPGSHRTISLSLALPLGLVVGLLTGLVGIGGGFLIVPALVLFGAVPMKEAIGTSLLVIAMNAAAGFVGYVGQVSIPWGYTIAFAGVAIVGILLGSSLVRFVSGRVLQTTFAIFLVLVAAFVLYRNRQVFRDGWAASPQEKVAPTDVR